MPYFKCLASPQHALVQALSMAFDESNAAINDRSVTASISVGYACLFQKSFLRHNYEPGAFISR